MWIGRLTLSYNGMKLRIDWVLGTMWAVVAIWLPTGCSFLSYDLQVFPYEMPGAANAINNTDSAAGEVREDSEQAKQAMVWSISSPSQFRRFNTREGFTAINDEGDAVTYGWTHRHQYPPLLLTGNDLIILSQLGHGIAIANDINAKFVVGNVKLADESRQAFTYEWRTGILTRIPVRAGSSYSTANAINAKNEVVGVMDGNAFFYSAGETHVLGPGRLYDINDNGIAVGVSYSYGVNEIFHHPVWINCYEKNAGFNLIPLAWPLRLGGEALAINNKGTVVLTAYADKPGTPFLYAIPSVYDLRTPNVPAMNLNKLIRANTDWIVLDARDINNKGQIAGYVRNRPRPPF